MKDHSRIKPPISPLIWQGDGLRFLDQRLLPHKVHFVQTRDWRVVRRGIRSLAIRGAPLIGVAAAYATVLAAKFPTQERNFSQYLRAVISSLKNARPTAFNPFWALSIMEDMIWEHRAEDREKLGSELEKLAVGLENEERERCEAIALWGKTIIPKKAKILTLCNTGFLATPGMGTALGIIYRAYQEGSNVQVYVLETRPLLQGSRLTMWELVQMKIPARLLTDGAVGHLLQKEGIDLALIGADRIASNGDTANKVGSLNLAILCRHYQIPLYVAAPFSSIDTTVADGSGIPIEMRSEREITYFSKRSIAPKGINVFNPAFDIIPHFLITAIITEKGISYPPYQFSLPLD
ncbi:MAG: S-methyl-5-thioribose-1-phosphate isomerase [bacterium]